MVSLHVSALWTLRPVCRHTPRFEHRNGLEVHHPRYALLPKVGMHLAPHAMALGALPTIKRLAERRL